VALADVANLADFKEWRIYENGPGLPV